ncbi:MAG: O-acetylhomoserine aminocarboxypropyltransferase/cysteine synthase family protein [Acidimicrobiales bacterium]
MRDETIAIHGGYRSDSTRAVAVPIYQTVAHEFDDAAHAGAVFDMDEPGFHYNRLNNPTNDVLEQRLAALERGVGALTLSSGTAAVLYAIQNIAAIGDNIVSTPQLYGTTYTLFVHVFPTQGIEVRLARDDSPAAIGELIDSSTKAIFCESIGNPAGNIVDIEAVSAVAHGHGIPLIVDNTVATPLLLKPVEHGADVVVHSLTKYVGGHGTTLAGAIVDGGRFPWAEHPDRFPIFSRPEPAFHGVIYAERFGEAAYIVRCRTVGLRNQGSTLSPLGAFLLLQGLETMAVRMERHESNARAVADFLASDRRVAWVNFMGLPDSPHHAMAKRYLDGHASALFTFGAVGGYEAGIKFFDAVKLFKRLVNLGDAKSLVSHPASTTHRQLTPEDLAVVGVTPDMIRLSVGIEHIDDILEDIDQALGVATGES